MSASPATSDDADVRVTAVGYAQLCAELEALRTVSRREMSEQLRDVREEGDPDNPLLFDLLEQQAQLEVPSRHWDPRCAGVWGGWRSASVLPSRTRRFRRS